jgi:[ribosomal protein S5]-alanine N-acetyltransferase
VLHVFSRDCASRLEESDFMTRSEASNSTSVLSVPSFEDVSSVRLDLVAMSPGSLRCQAEDALDMRSRLGAILRCKVPDGWPHENWEPHVYEYLLNLIATDAESMGWCRYILLRGDDGERRLIGTFGSGLPKAETGEAEIGYGLLPEYQRQGYAAEAVMAMLPWLRSRRPVKAFVAQTFPHLYGSIRVMEKCGMVYAGPGFEEGTILHRKVV